MNNAACNIPLMELPDGHLRGVGVLSVVKESARVSLPLAGVDISARVAERVAQVVIKERFRNTQSEHLEAVYIFPLPGGAAVSDFLLKVGARTIRGKVEERGEARRQYQQAIEEGKRAAIMEKERDDVFTVQVGNLPPGEEVTVEITYSERLPFFEDGTTELRLPLVVAPRYIPGQALDRDSVGDGMEVDTDVVPDASRITPPLLVKGFDPKVALGIEVELMIDKEHGESEIGDLSCSQHATRTGMGANSVRVSLARQDEPLDRDFVLRWTLASQSVRPAMLVYRDQQGAAYGMLSIIPPKREGFLGTPRDVIFVVDRSGSMQGVKMVSATRACSLLLATLGPRDRFAIQAFDNVAQWFVPDKNRPRDYFLPADEGGLERGMKFLTEIDARGGTEMYVALGEALQALVSRSQTAGRVPVIVLITDGEVGDESRIFKRIQTELGDARVFTVGVDTAVNEGFLRKLAALGGGTATFVEPGVQLEEALRAVGREIGTPLVVDVTIEDVDAGLDSASIAPNRVPDLFAGRATTAFFRLNARGVVRVKGRFADGGKFEHTIGGREIDLPAIAQLWARQRISDLEDRFRVEFHNQADLRRQIIDIAVRHTLLTRFTAFVVVDESEVVNQGGDVKKVVQPVEMPARWEMDMQSSQNYNLTRAGSIRPSAPMAPMSMAPPPPPQSAPKPAPQAESSNLTAAGSIVNREEYEALKKQYSAKSTPPARGRMPVPQEESASLGELEADDSDYETFSVQAPKKDEGLFGRAVDAITDLFRSRRDQQAQEPSLREAKPAAQMPADAQKKRKADPVLDEIRRALQQFFKIYEQALSDLKANRLPNGKELEQARADLVKALAKSELGAQVPALQRFLRSSAVEIVAALSISNAKPADVLAVFERNAKQYGEARNEADQKVSGGGGSFWETNI